MANMEGVNYVLWKKGEYFIKELQVQPPQLLKEVRQLEINMSN